MRVAFVGLGNMGQAMARNLVRAGHELMVYNLTRARADLLRADGARVASSAAEAGSGGRGGHHDAGPTMT